MKEDKYKNILVALLPDGNNVKKKGSTPLKFEKQYFTLAVRF